MVKRKQWFDIYMWLLKLFILRKLYILYAGIKFEGKLKKKKRKKKKKGAGKGTYIFQYTHTSRMSHWLFHKKEECRVHHFYLSHCFLTPKPKPIIVGCPFYVSYFYDIKTHLGSWPSFYLKFWISNLSPMVRFFFFSFLQVSQVSSHCFLRHHTDLWLI